MNKVFVRINSIVLSLVVSVGVGFSIASNRLIESNKAVAADVNPNAQTFLFKKLEATQSDYSGTYLIVSSDKSNHYIFNGSLAKANIDSTSSSIVQAIDTKKPNVIERPNKNETVTIESINGGYAIKTTTGYYIGRSKGPKTNTINTDASPLLNTITYNATGVDIVSSFTNSKGTHNHYLRYNSSANQSRFRYYTSNTSCEPVFLYKLTAATLVSKITITGPDTVDIGGTVQFHSEITPTSASNPTLTWASSDSNIAAVSQEGLVSGVNPGTAIISASSNDGSLVSGTKTITVNNQHAPIVLNDHYKLITSESELIAGMKLIIASKGQGVSTLKPAVMSYQDTYSRTSIAVTKDTVNNTIDKNEGIAELTLGGSANQWTLKDEAINQYLYCASSATYNNLKSEPTISELSKWNITINANGVASITAITTTTDRNNLYFNDSNLTFSCYRPKTGVGDENWYVELYKLVSPEPSVEATLESITVTTLPNKLNYTIGDNLDVKGILVNGRYSDNTMFDVTSDCSYSPTSLLSEGTQTITVTHIPSNKQATFSVNVTNIGTTKTYELIKDITTLNANDKVIIVGLDNNEFSSMSNTPKPKLPYYFPGNLVNPNDLNIKADGLSEWSVSVSNSNFILTSGTNDLYAYIDGTHSSINLGITRPQTQTDTLEHNVVTDFGGSNLWNILINSDGVCEISATLQTSTVILAYEQPYGTFSGAASTTSKLYLYKSVETTSNMYIASFLNGLTCDPNGVNPPSTNEWNTLKTSFNSLDPSVKHNLKVATSNQNGTTIEKGVARYDYIISKYGVNKYENFMSRGISPSLLHTLQNKDADNEYLNFCIIMATIFLGSLSIIGCYHAHRMKKKNSH